MTLFDVSPPLSRRSDPSTSHAAARSVGRGAEIAVLGCLNLRGPSTDDEICAALQSWPSYADLYGPTVKSARSRLTKAGYLVDSGERRPSDRGRLMVVWVRV